MFAPSKKNPQAGRGCRRAAVRNPRWRVEGILRRWSYEGETVLPEEPAAFGRVSVRCGYGPPEAFGRAVAEWRRGIRDVYDQVLGAGETVDRAR